MQHDSPLPLAKCLPPGWNLRIEHLPSWGTAGESGYIPEKFLYFLTDMNGSPAVSARHIAVETIEVAEETSVITRLFAEVRAGGAKQREKQEKKEQRRKR